MTKDEKLRAIIHKDVSSGFMYELEKQLRTQSHYVKKLSAHPDFIPSVINEIVEHQLTYYRTVSAEGVDKAYDFFMSDAGSEWCLLSAKFVTTLNEWAPRFVEELVERLNNLN
jgi:hypothetical protein